jgi:hypothetical protein
VLGVGPSTISVGSTGSRRGWRLLHHDGLEAGVETGRAGATGESATGSSPPMAASGEAKPLPAGCAGGTLAAPVAEALTRPTPAPTRTAVRTPAASIFGFTSTWLPAKKIDNTP